MNVDEHGSPALSGTSVAATKGAGFTPRRRWAVVNMDSQYHKTVLVTRWRWYAGWWAASLRIFDGDDMRIVRTTDQHRAPTSARTAAATGAAAVTSRRRWAVVNLDSQYHKTVLVTRWRWYAGWWAASLRIFDGDDMRIVRTGPTTSSR